MYTCSRFCLGLFLPSWTATSEIGGGLWSPSRHCISLVLHSPPRAIASLLAPFPEERGRNPIGVQERHISLGVAESHAGAGSPVPGGELKVCRSARLVDDRNGHPTPILADSGQSVKSFTLSALLTLAALHSLFVCGIVGSPTTGSGGKPKKTRDIVPSPSTGLWRGASEVFPSLASAPAEPGAGIRLAEAGSTHGVER
jgi:hypothetical protein